MSGSTCASAWLAKPSSALTSSTALTVSRWCLVLACFSNSLLPALRSALQSLHLARYGSSGTLTSQFLKRSSSSHDSRNFCLYHLIDDAAEEVSPPFRFPGRVSAAPSATWLLCSGTSAVTGSSMDSAKIGSKHASPSS
uniref:Putative secreted protein n=1 Tax=Ixodes ricinus TaxID=34613 RepID=A0A6B0UT08_IXORI